jgi:tRNA-specific adenosine deaminase 3
MGLLLSRFRAVIFPRRGRMNTGGLASEPVPKDPVGKECHGSHSGHSKEDRQYSPEHSTSYLATEEPTIPRNQDRHYYGLHWRSELNWRALGFEFVEDDLEDVTDISRSRQEDTIVTFHA